MSEKGFVSKKNLSRAWNRLFGKVLNSKEEIEANTSENMIAGAEAVKEVYSSLQDSSSGESFNFGSLNGVRGFFTNPSKADDSFVPFKSGTEVAIFIGAKNMVSYNILILSDGTCKNAESTPVMGNKMEVYGSKYTALKSGKFKIVIPRVSTDSTVFTAVEKYVNAGNTIFQGADLGYGVLGSCVYAID